MAAEIPSDIPDELVAGDTWKWTVSFPEYPAGDGWVVSYYLRGAGTLDATATADGDEHAVVVAAADTEDLTAGVYQFIARAALGGEVYTVDSGAVTILPNAETAAAGALQSEAEVMLARVRSEIRARITGDGSGHESYQIAGRALGKIPLLDLKKLEAQYAGAVAREKNGGRLPSTEVWFARG